MSELSRMDPLSKRQWISALADGEADSEAQGCALWAGDADAREAWHTYHLIGDALRSDDLAFSPGHDATFLAALHERLQAEPVVLAPSTLPIGGAPARAARRRWAPAAVAAGFVAVAGVLVMSRAVAPGAPAGSGPVLASSASSPMTGGQAQGLVPAAAAIGEPQWRVVDGQLIRDARLDGYLRAHRSGPAALPGGAIGRFETVVLER